ncbi:citrate lyase acyl carrier protein [Enterococcus quebecensis]|uniref:Citrate lyase acyl carrier protein n=1 Tax=Enterococcus quebecensis TaxID=903983 RepID=A0A1E5H388_9ENTE|nr:citrate lyase acyl carrier protein [Enterococcus quebecensis]OEG19352.1 citrate lyase acyl carrier protein [Enterococcus quebecensis]
MEIKQNASAGTTESSDILIMLDPSETNGIQIDLNSSVEKQFGRQIRAKIRETLEKLDVTNVKVNAVDKGALDCTIEARTVAAVYRGAGEETIDWQVIHSWKL